MTSISLKEGTQIRETVKKMYVLVTNYGNPPSIKEILNDTVYIFSHKIIPTTRFYIIVSFSGSPCFPRKWISSKKLKVKLSIELKGHFVSICISRLMFFKSTHMLTMEAVNYRGA